MNPLYMLSKTDPALVSKCNQRTKMHQRGMGLFVLVTALFAFVSSYYALTTVFGDWDELTLSYLLSNKNKVIILCASLLYALAIGLIDRDIVSSKNKLAAGLRIPLAIIIGLVISVPLKLKVLEKRINQGIRDEQLARIHPFQEEQNRYIHFSDSVLNNLEMQVSYYTKLKNDEQKRMEAEDLGYSGFNLSGVIGQGQRFRYAKSNVDNYAGIVEDLKQSIQQKKEESKIRLAHMKNDQQTFKSIIYYDFWSRYEALHRIIEEDRSNQAKMLVLGLSLLFIMLELIPALIKLLTPKNEYDMVCEYLDRRIKKRMDDFDFDDDFEDYISLPEIKVSDKKYHKINHFETDYISKN